jgi:ankyrin repeat protein
MNGLSQNSLRIILIAGVFSVVLLLVWSGNERLSRAEMKRSIQAGNWSQISRLIKRHPQLINADLGERQENLHSLALASSLGQEIVCRNLLEAGADVNAADVYSNTPLYYAVRSENAAIVKLLLEHGADMKRRNMNGWTPLDLARQLKVPECIEAILAASNHYNTNRP